MGLFRKLAKKAVEVVAGRSPESGVRSPEEGRRDAAPPSADQGRAAPPPSPSGRGVGGEGRAAAVTKDPASTLATIEAGAQEVKERIDAGEPVLLLDVREPFETAAGIIPGARIIPLGQLPQRWKEVADANEVVCYCAAGSRSLQAAGFLRDNGVFNATSLVGGIGEWMAVGGSIVRPG